jgi:DNA-binding NtrC family response regulator
MKKRVKENRSLLIVEDDVSQLNRYLQMARNASIEATGVDTLERAIAQLAHVGFKYVLTDIHLNGPGRQNTFEGFEILREVKKNHPETIPLVMSSDPQIETYYRSLREGAAYFFRKPILTESELLIHLDVATKGRRTRGLAKHGISGQMLPMALQHKFPNGLVLPKEIRERARKASLSDSIPIIILGETGSGKEEVAKLIHRLRTEAQGTVPFVAINCANLTGDTAISALFGHRRGAFTGAEQTTAGFIGEADGGFLFLDEIHTLSMDCQKRLLRVLNDGSYTRLGDTQTLYSDFQVIVATTKDLDEEVERGNFLLDLRGRLTGLQINIPPLRDRKTEMPELIELALAKQGIEVQSAVLTSLVDRCSKYYWQGNVRQLFQVLNVLVTEAVIDHKEIHPLDLPEFKTMWAPGVTEGRSITPPSDNAIVSKSQKLFHESLTTDLPIEEVVKAVEEAILQEAMTRHGSIEKVSKALGIAENAIARSLGIL